MKFEVYAYFLTLQIILNANKSGGAHIITFPNNELFGDDWDLKKCNISESLQGVCVRPKHCVHDLHTILDYGLQLNVCEFGKDFASSFVCCPRNATEIEPIQNLTEGTELKLDVSTVQTIRHEPPVHEEVNEGGSTLQSNTILDGVTVETGRDYLGNGSTTEGGLNGLEVKREHKEDNIDTINLIQMEPHLLERLEKLFELKRQRVQQSLDRKGERNETQSPSTTETTINRVIQQSRATM